MSGCEVFHIQTLQLSVRCRSLSKTEEAPIYNHSGPFFARVLEDAWSRIERKRIALDGAPAETVDAEAKDLAAKQLAKLAAASISPIIGQLTGSDPLSPL